jgi:hypothetical protein
MILLLQRTRDGVAARARVPAKRYRSPRPRFSARTRGNECSMLVVDRARKLIGGLVAVNDLSFEISRGETRPDRP